MNLSYDPKADVLYIWFEETPRTCEYIEPTPGAVLRVDPQTKHIVGCTILFFKKRMQKSGKIEVPEIRNLKLPDKLQKLLNT